MCGIVGYVGKREAYKILVKGIERLEYRGYDSAGIALINQGNLSVLKKKGKVSELQKLISKKSIKQLKSEIGIAHTRWATHGAPSDKNAHPQVSNSGGIAIVHNGIIENYASLKEILVNKGYKFQSDTDTEVLVNLVEYFKKEEEKKGKKVDLAEAVSLSLREVTGAYAILVISRDEPDTLIVAKKGSPAVIGLGQEEYFVASDIAPIAPYTNQVIYLKDGEMGIIQPKKLSVQTIGKKFITPSIEELEIEKDELELGKFPHFMLKEIFEQPKSIADSLRGRIRSKEGKVKLGGIENCKEKLLSAKRLVILACGTSWHAGLEARYFLEQLAHIPVSVEYASEFRYRKPVIYKEDVFVAISQSGETADTLAAMLLAQEKGATVLSITNVAGSTIARTAEAGLYTHAGAEIGVASTKAFTSQLAVLWLLAILIASEKKILSLKEIKRLLKELEAVPAKVAEALRSEKEIKKIAKKFKSAQNFIYLGRGYGFPLALEGSLKLKEISYVHAEGYPAGEMKHGPIALVDKKMPVLFIANHSEEYEKIISNMMEVKARKGIVIAILTKGDIRAKKIADYFIEIPKTGKMSAPFTVSIPLQLFAYYMALFRGCEIDKPRNLAKSVTVE